MDVRFDEVTQTRFEVPRSPLTDRLEIEVGDSKQPQFFPQVKLLRWNNECNFSARLSGADKGTLLQDESRSRWIEADRETRLYALEPSDLHPEGAFELDVVLYSQPATNTLDFTLQFKNCEFFYQPPLSEEELKEGCFRPDHVVGSYAVYHAQPPKNHVGGNTYRAGKIAHIYRPWIVDAKGQGIWGELSLSDDCSLLTVTIPQSFLDNASYPVIVDPTFGYTSAGGTHVSRTTNAYGSSKFTAPSDVGTVSKLTFYALTVSSGSGKGMIHLASDNSLVASGGAVSISAGMAAWYDSTFSSPSLTASTDYVLGSIHSASSQNFIYYDTGSTNQGYTGSNSYATPSALSSPTLSTRKYSVYATYAAAGGTTHTLSTSANLGVSTALQATVAFNRHTIRDVFGFSTLPASSLAFDRSASSQLGLDDGVAYSMLWRRLALLSLGCRTPELAYLVRWRRKPQDNLGISEDFAQQTIALRDFTGNLGLSGIAPYAEPVPFRRTLTANLGLDSLCGALQVPFILLITTNLGLASLYSGNQVPFIRLVPESLGLSTDWTRQTDFERAVYEALGLGTDWAREPVPFLRVVSTGLGLATAFSRDGISERLLSTEFILGDQVLYDLLHRRDASASLGLDDSLSTSLARGLALAESLGMADDFQQTAILQRLAQDDLGLQDLARAGALWRMILTANLGVDNAVLPATISLRSMAENLGCSTTQLVDLIFRRSLQGLLGLQDARQVATIASREVSDSAGFSSDVQVATLLLRQVADILALAEIFSGEVFTSGSPLLALLLEHGSFLGAER